MYFFQLPVAFLLFMVIAFGIGFIINMLIKTTWFPTVLYFIILGIIFIYIGKFSTADVVVLSGGLAGAVLCGFVIRTLRVKGYRMF